MIDKYEAELDKCREIVQLLHPIGKVKHIGLMEVATALEQLLSVNQQPVDWPTEPGWWWMDIPSRESIICMANGGDVWLKGVNGVTYSKTECDRRGARFLPLFIPTFPPREER